MLSINKPCIEYICRTVSGKLVYHYNKMHLYLDDSICKEWWYCNALHRVNGKLTCAFFPKKQNENLDYKVFPDIPFTSAVVAYSCKYALLVDENKIAIHNTNGFCFSQISEYDYWTKFSIFGDTVAGVWEDNLVISEITNKKLKHIVARKLPIKPLCVSLCHDLKTVSVSNKNTIITMDL